MNKKELALVVGAKAGISNASARRAVNAVFDAIEDAVSRKESVKIMGFGVFSAVRTKSRVSRNPRTGESLTVKARNRPVFKAGASLKSAIN